MRKLLWTSASTSTEYGTNIHAVINWFLHPYIYNSDQINVHKKCSLTRNEPLPRANKPTNLWWGSLRVLPAVPSTCVQRGWVRGPTHSRSTSVVSSEQSPQSDHSQTPMTYHDSVRHIIDAVCLYILVPVGPMIQQNWHEKYYIRH